MNLPLPLFDLPLADAPARPPPALPQAGGGGSVQGRARGGHRASPAPGVADVAIQDLFPAWAPPLPRAGTAGLTGCAAGSGPDIDTDIDTDRVADSAAAAATDPLVGAGFEAALGAVARASRLAELHPSLWRASQIGGAAQRTTASGFEALDAQLPGGGWPHGTLTELLLAQAGVGELRLLAPALAALAPGQADAAPGGQAPGGGSRSRAAGSDEGRCVMLFDPPAGLSAWALVQCGLSSRHWLVVQARAGQAAAPQASPRGANRLSPLLPSADLLWALEQSLKSGHVGAILAWLPLNLRADALRRLQIAAQAHDGPVFVFRDAQARSKPSPAPLRLLLQPAGVDGLSVRLLKRRGPPLAQPLRLALPSVLTPQQQAQAQARDLTRQVARPVRDALRMR